MPKCYLQRFENEEMKLASLFFLLCGVLVVLLPAVTSGYANCAGNGSCVGNKGACLSRSKPGYSKYNCGDVEPVVWSVIQSDREMDALNVKADSINSGVAFVYSAIGIIVLFCLFYFICYHKCKQSRLKKSILYAEAGVICLLETSQTLILTLRRWTLNKGVFLLLFCSVGARTVLAEDNEMLAEISDLICDFSPADMLTRVKDMQNKLLTFSISHIHNLEKDYARLNENSMEATEVVIDFYYQNLDSVCARLAFVEYETLLVNRHYNITKCWSADVLDCVMQVLTAMKNEMLANCTSQINTLKRNIEWQSKSLMKATEDDNKVSYQSSSFAMPLD
ncbi:uncharacterized protein LOC131949045 [Physella acuta]|uniref:uncharacterized protein LOC131949045 n=1 Tax=Physella acuta TaxID=109671 RepID=UPI0027DC360B|nr:uncharacterized protein LOC131949045 [Physella acuta]